MSVETVEANNIDGDAGLGSVLAKDFRIHARVSNYN